MVTTRTFYYLKNNAVMEREVPKPTHCILPGVPWGKPEAMFTPAYWMTQYWMQEGSTPTQSHRLGQTLEEEVVACLLGGYGIPAEIGLAAFERLRDRGLIASRTFGQDLLSETLREPLSVGGRTITYRFWSQKSRYLTEALRCLSEQAPPLESALDLRAYLMELPGIGPKTASWIVRNWLASNEVAILDIHVVRAGQLMNLYSPEDRVEDHYLEMESRFLQLAAAMAVPASDLDALIWYQMRSSPHLVAQMLDFARKIPSTRRHP